MMANSKRKCIHCREYAQAESGIVTPVGFFCSFDHAAKHAQAKRDKQRADKPKLEARAARKAKREYYDNDRSHQFKLTKEVVQRWACKVRDEGRPCISCSTMANVQYAGGHYRTVGANPELALDTRNIHRQCNRRCNCELGGNIYGAMNTHGYVVGLVNRYGQEFVDWLDGYHPPKKYTCEQLKEIRAYYAKLTRLGIKTDEDSPYK